MLLQQRKKWSLAGTSMKDYSNFKPVAVKGKVPKLSDKRFTTISDNVSELEVCIVSTQIQIK